MMHIHLFVVLEIPLSLFLFLKTIECMVYLIPIRVQIDNKESQ